MLTLFILVTVFELGFYALKYTWFLRKIVASALILVTAFLVSAQVMAQPNATAFALGIVSLFRIFNLFRIVEGRMHSEYLRQAVMRSGWFLVPLCVALFAAQTTNFSIIPSNFWLIIGWTQVGAAAILLLVTVKTLHSTRFKDNDRFYSDKELPTVSVLIPARNETADLESCLQSVLANDYPKIEVLVLDDCSQDKTSEIIKQFAQDGVRFIPGAVPADRWLAKNQAYQRLYQESTGEILLFCGVDVRLGTTTIRSLVTVLNNRNKDMVSVLPRRLDATPLAAIIQPIRYWWELALPRRLFNKPAVLSTCWVIRRKKLKSLGGFAAVSHAIIPEQYFARELVKSDAYSFMRAGEQIDVQTLKSPSAQHHTAIRTRYPQLKRRPEYVLAIIFLEILLLLLPFVQLAGFWLGMSSVPVALTAVSCLLLTLTNITIVSVTNPGNSLLSAINLPIAVVVEIYNTLISMVRYEFSVIEWKGRNICIPVMHVIPKLPALKD